MKHGKRTSINEKHKARNLWRSYGVTKKVKELKENTFDPAKEAKEKENLAIVESAKKSVKQNLFSEELSKKFSELESAIEIKSAELKELYGVESELQSLTAVVNARKEMTAKLDEEMITKRTEIETMKEEMLKEYSDKKKEAATDFALYQDDLKKQREREKEEYAYDLKRSRTKENDEWEDEKAARETAIADLELKAKEMFAEAEAKVNYITELEEKVNSIPKLIEEAKAQGAEEATKEAGKEYGYKKTMAEKEYSYEKQRLEDKIERLETELAKSTDLNDSLQVKLDNVYAQIRELATKTVESTGGVKILGNATADVRK